MVNLNFFRLLDSNMGVELSANLNSIGTVSFMTQEVMRPSNPMEYTT